MTNENFALVSWLLVAASVASLVLGLLGFGKYFGVANGSTSLLLLLLWIGFVASLGGHDTNSLELLFYLVEILIIVMSVATIQGRHIKPFLSWIGWVVNALAVTVIYAVAHMGPMRLW